MNGRLFSREELVRIKFPGYSAQMYTDLIKLNESGTLEIEIFTLPLKRVWRLPMAGEIVWEKSLSKAVQLADKEKKQVLVDFTSPS
jgi:hypothetical protein